MNFDVVMFVPLYLKSNALVFFLLLLGKIFFIDVLLHSHYLSYNVLVNVPVCMIKRLKIFTLS